jgi:hypothetical protein
MKPFEINLTAAITHQNMINLSSGTGIDTLSFGQHFYTKNSPFTRAGCTERTNAAAVFILEREKIKGILHSSDAQLG